MIEIEKFQSIPSEMEDNVLLLDTELISAGHTCHTQSRAEIHTVRKQFVLYVSAILTQIKTTELRMQRISWNCRNSSMLTQFQQKHLSKTYVVQLQNDYFKCSTKC